MSASRFIVSTLTVLLLTSIGAAQTPITFFQPESIGSCASLAVADFNGDGNLDVACAGNTLTIWLGDGHGNFRQTAQTLPYVNAQVVAGDFNGDGRPDLAIAGSGQLILLPGKGNGTFGQQIAIGTLTAYALAAADLTHNGRLDLLVSTPPTPDAAAVVEVFLSNGNGTFQSPIATGLTAGQYVNIAVADFNGDGIPDVASIEDVESDITLSVALGKGDGTFDPPVATAIDVSPVPFAVADFTGDGIPDVALEYGSEIYVYTGNGDGTFSAGPVSTGNPIGVAILASDLNGDGRPDLVVSGIGVALNQGGGVFGEIEFYEGLNNYAGIAADFRHLGRPDLEIGGDFYPNNGNGHFQAPRSFPIALCNACYLVPGDFHNDGNLDVAAIAGDAVSVYAGDGHGNFTGFRESPFKVPDREVAVVAAAAYFNGDGNLDLMLGAGNYIRGVGEATLMPGNGNGTFQPPAVVYTGNAVTSLVTADFNRDGHPDIAIGTHDAAVVMCGNGAGGFTTTATVTGIFNMDSLVVADFNQDGIPDLATASDVYLGNGDGTFRHAYTLPQPGSLVEMGHFTGAGAADLLTTDGYNIILWPGNGDGTFGLPIAVTTSLEESAFFVADLNGDGISDIAVTNYNALTLYLGRGDGTFAMESVGNLPAFGSLFATGDFNNDGRTDLLFISLYNQLMTLTNTTE